MKKEKNIIGRVTRVNGPVITGESTSAVKMLDIAEVGEEHLIGEIVRIYGNSVTIQVYEDTTLIRPGDQIYGTGMPLSVALGPGLLGTIYDGIQRPLAEIEKVYNFYIERGIQPSALSKDKKWDFSPTVKKGDTVKEGNIIGTVQETSFIEHRVLLPVGIEGVIEDIKKGQYTVNDVVCKVQTDSGLKEVTMVQNWPIRNPRKVRKRLPIIDPLITGQRVIDTLFPVAKGGSCVVPGGFGTGKTMVQHQLAKWCDADVILVRRSFSIR